MMRSILIAASAASLLFAVHSNADVYLYKDAQGNVQYTDKPPRLPAERLNVQSQKTDTVTLQARQEADMKRMQQGNQARDKAAAQQNDQRQAAELSAKDKAERCVKARQRYDSYMNTRRLYEEQNGERRYLSDEELDAARAQAKTSMEEMCK